MELLDKNIEKLKDLWSSEDDRQNAKIVIMEAIGRATDVSVKEASEICDVLDVILDSTEPEVRVKKETAL